MLVFKKDSEKMAETNISSKYSEEKKLFFSFLNYFPLWLLRERVECISLISKELTGNWLNCKSATSLVSEHLIP